MIKHISSNSSFLKVETHNSGAWIHNNGPLSGQLRLNQAQELEVYDGNTWHRFVQSVSIGMHQDADAAIFWAISKMKEEKDREAQMAKYPMLKEAYEKYKTIEVLVSE